MADIAKMIREEHRSFVDSFDRMKKLVNSLPDVWTGDASEKYLAQFEDLTPGFNSTCEVIFDIATQIDDSSKVFLQMQILL